MKVRSDFLVNGKRLRENRRDYVYPSDGRSVPKKLILEQLKTAGQSRTILFSWKF